MLTCAKTAGILVPTIREERVLITYEFRKPL